MKCLQKCYKFQTKTDMEEADIDDLVSASSQGTMLEIKVNGKTYGSGGYTSDPEPSVFNSFAFHLATVALSGCIVAIIVHSNSHIIERNMPKALKEVFIDNDSVTTAFELTKVKKKKKKKEDWIVLRARSKRDCHDILYNSDYVRQVNKHKEALSEKESVKDVKVSPTLDSEKEREVP